MKTQVLIIGAGPVGLTAALLLSNYGISSMIVDRRFERMTAPKAHAINPRTIEICDQAGLPGELLRSYGTPAELAGWVRFVSNLSGVEFGNLPYERQTDEALKITPFPLTNLSQPKFEFLLANKIQERSNVSLLRGAQCDGLVQSEHGVKAQIMLRGNDRPLSIEADYVLAADGAGSRTRDALEIGMEGPDALQNYVMIHCEGDLSAFIPDRPGILFFTFDPEAGGAFIFYDDTKTWVYMKSYDPDTESRNDFDESRCRREVIKAIGSEQVNFVVRNVSPWTMTAQIATAYQRGRVFLVGDAAHRFPPTGGLGLNTGVGDAHNICWKLAYVLNGKAHNTLLDSYEQERRPVALNNSEQSLANAAKMFEVIAALYGADPTATATHFAKICEAPAKHPEIENAIEAQRPHFDSIRLQLGYRYHSSALVGSREPDGAADDDISVYRPSYEVGALLPHDWVDTGYPRRSVLSMLDPVRFTLVCGEKAADWKGVAGALSSLVAIADYPRSWSSQTGLADDGALLVRPDGHIAARYEGANSASAETLSADLATILAKEA